MDFFVFDYFFLLSAAFLGLWAVFLVHPFISWPMDPHLGVFFRWPYFHPGEPVPEQLIRGNQGFSRIYLYYLALWIIRCLGRRRLQAKVTIVQGTFLWLTSVMIVAMARKLMGFASLPAIAAAAGYLFLATRPKFTFFRYNAEPHYSLFALLGTSALMLAQAGGNTAWLWAGFGAVVLTTAILNTKVVFLLEAGLLGLATLVLCGWPWPMFWALLAGCVLASVAFYFMFRQYLSLDSVRQLLFYARWAAIGHGRPVSSRILGSFLKKTPLGASLFFSLVGTGAMVLNGRTTLPVVLLVSSIILLLLQCRKEGYQFQILLPPIGLTLAGTFQIAWNASIWAFFGGLACYIVALLYRTDAVCYYRQEPLRNKLLRTFGSSYYSLYDTRVEPLMREHATHPGPFLAWSNTPYANLLADQAPYTYMGVHRSFTHKMFPGHQYKLVEAMITVPHEWVYDLDWAMNGIDRFNALAVYAGLGLLYVPVKRQENIVHYRLAAQRTNWEINREINFYMTSGPTGDLFQQELEWYGLESPKRPDGRPWNILELCTMLLEGKMFTPADALKDTSLHMTDRDKEPGIALLYGAAACLLNDDTEMARGLLQQWRSPDNPYMRISPALRVADWFFGLRAGLDGRPFPLDEHDLNRVLMLEAADTGRFLLHYLSLIDDAPDAKVIARCIKTLRIPETDHKCRVLARELATIKGCLMDSIPIHELPEGNRVLVVRMAPMDMLQSLLEALDGKDVRLSAVAQESVRDVIEAGGAFQEVHTIPDGIFRASKTTDALASALLNARYDACIVLFHWIVEANTNDVLSFIRHIGAQRNYAYMDANQHKKTLFPLDSLLVEDD